MNIVGFYEASTLSFRLAYLWRSEYIAARGSFVSVTPLDRSTNSDHQFARIVDATGRWDARINLNINKCTSVFAEFVNITKENKTTYLEFENNFAGALDVESRWLLGTKWTF